MICEGRAAALSRIHRARDRAVRRTIPVLTEPSLSSARQPIACGLQDVRAGWTKSQLRLCRDSCLRLRTGRVSGFLHLRRTAQRCSLGKDMRGFVIFIFLAGYVAVLALYAITAAQGRSALQRPTPCISKTQSACGPGEPARNVLVICLRSPGRGNESCLMAFSPV